MSDAVDSAGESGGGDWPAKKSKHNEIVAFGGPMDDEETAREKLEEAEFDPDKPDDLLHDTSVKDIFGSFNAMSYFCTLGDLQMCRYLLSKGASTTQSWDDDFDVDDYDSDDDPDIRELNRIPSPMYAAARGGHLNICKLLCEHGARGDIRKTNDFFYSPLCVAIYVAGRVGPTESENIREVCRWLILNEALCPRDNGFISDNLLDEALEAIENTDEAPYFLGWAEDAVQTHDGFMTFLMGTYPREVPTFTAEGFEMMLEKKFHSPVSKEIILNHLPDAQRRLLWREERNGCALQCLSGHAGIREHIANMLGVARGRNLRILRELQRRLTSYVEEAACRARE